MVGRDVQIYESLSEEEWAGFRSSLRLDISAHNLSSVSSASSNLVSISSSWKTDVSNTAPSTENARIYPPGISRWGVSVREPRHKSREHARFITLNCSVQSVHQALFDALRRYQRLFGRRKLYTIVSTRNKEHHISGTHLPVRKKWVEMWSNKGENQEDSR